MMKAARRFASRLAAIFARRRSEDKLSEQLRSHSHFERQTEENLRAGLSAVEARRVALLKLGGVEVTKESYRGQRGLPRLENFFLDWKHAVRGLRKNPGFTLVAVLTLALGIGANTAILSVADAVLFRPLPYADPDRVHILLMLDKKTGQHYGWMPFEYLRTLDEHHRGLGKTGIAESGGAVFNSGEPENVSLTSVSADYFRILGIGPALGRLLNPDDQRAVMLSYGAWQQRFGGDKGVLGRAVQLGKTTFEVVGVLPKGFVFPARSAGRPEFVTLMEPLDRVVDGGAVDPIVRLEPEVTREQAQAEIEALIGPLAARKPDSTVPVLADIRTELYPVGRPIMRYLLAAALLVLLIGCANLANMLLTRTQRREREYGVRAALGASRIRLMRPVIFESVIVGLAGAGLALVVTSAAFDALLPHVPAGAYGNAPVGVSERVVVLTFALGLVGGLLFAVVPAWGSARLDALALIRGRYVAGNTGVVRSPMVAVQVALSVLLVFGAVSASREFLAALRIPMGFTPENVVTVRVAPPPGLSGLGRREFYARAAAMLARRGDVAAAGTGGAIPMSGAQGNEPVKIAGKRDSFAAVHIQPGYFEAAGIHLKRGRLPNGLGEAAVSESVARSLFAGSDPVDTAVQDLKGRQYRVTGIIADVRTQPDHGLAASIYIVSGESTRELTLLVRTRVRHPALLAELKREIGALAPGTPVLASWWTDSIGALTFYRNPRFQTLVLASFAALALGLTGLGTYGIVAFMVGIRRHEMGVRLAIGAAPPVLVRLMVRQALTPVIAGLSLGSAATSWVSHLRQANDPATLALAAGTVAGAALLAAYIPARRVSRIDPTIALRHE